MSLPNMSNELICVNQDTLNNTTNLHCVVTGSKDTAWHPCVRGTDSEDNAVVGVAYYDHEYEYKADASSRARQLLRHVKSIIATKATA
jgi:hypothetical protein